jgi:hypothetical protein
MPKGHSYQGTHWMQKPENKARMLKILKKATAAKKAARKKSKAEKIVAKAVRKVHKKREPEKETTLVMNGWKVTLGHNTVKIEQS